MFTRGVLFVSGDPGSGKSTWARDVATALHLRHVSTGDKLLQAGDLSGARGAAFGNDELVHQLVKDEVAAGDEPGLLIDGYPRKPHQVWDLLKLCSPMPLSVVWHQVEPEEAIRRYRAAGYARSAASGKYGPRGETCPLGGRYELELETHYREKYAAQEEVLRDTLKSLEHYGVPLYIRTQWQEKPLTVRTSP